MPMAFDETPEQFKADLIAEFKGDVNGAREAYTIVAEDGWAPAFLFAHQQLRLPLPPCAEQPVSELSSAGRTLAESIVARALDAQ